MGELSHIKRRLNRNHKSIWRKLVNYIYASGVNTKVWKEIRVDLAGMLLESQERGENPEMLIGSDYKAFCDNLIENCPRKKSVDIVVEILFITGMAISIIVPMVYFWVKLNPTIEQYVDGFIYYASVRSLSILLSGAFGGGMGSFASHKYAFSRGKLVVFLFLYLLTFVILGVSLLTYLSHRMIDGKLIGIDMLKVELLALFTSMLLFVIREWRMNRQINQFEKNSI